MAEEEEERIDSEQLKDNIKPSFAPTVNIISHYTLPIDYPDSPSDDDDPDETKISSETEVHENQTKPLSPTECPSPKNCSIIPPSSSSSNNEPALLQNNAVNNKEEEALESKVEDTDNDNGTGSQATMIKSTDISVVYCHSTTVITTVSTETHYSQALEPLSLAPSSSSSLISSSCAETKENPSTLNKPVVMSNYDPEPTISSDDITPNDDITSNAIAASITDVSYTQRVLDDKPLMINKDETTDDAVDAGPVVETMKGSFGDNEETSYPEVTEGDNSSKEHNVDCIPDPIEEEVKLDETDEGLDVITNPSVIDQNNDIVETMVTSEDNGEPMEVVNKERQEEVSAATLEDKNGDQSLSHDIDQTKEISTNEANDVCPNETNEVTGKEISSQTESIEEIQNESSAVSNIVAPNEAEVMVVEDSSSSKEVLCEGTVENSSESTTEATEATAMTGSFDKEVHSPPEQASEATAHVEKDRDTSHGETDVKDVSVQEEVLKMEVVVPCIKESEIKCCNEELHESENEVTEETNLQEEGMECSTELPEREDEKETKPVSMLIDPQEELKEEQHESPTTKDHTHESSPTAISEEEVISNEEDEVERVAIVAEEVSHDEGVERETETEETEQSKPETDISIEREGNAVVDDNEEEEKQVMDPPIITGNTLNNDVIHVQEEMTNDTTTSEPSNVQENDTELEKVTINKDEEMTSDAVVERKMAESEKEEVELVANVISERSGDVPISITNEPIDTSATNNHHTLSPHDGAADSSDAETSSETEAKLVPESESQTVLPPCPVILPSLSSDSPPLTLSSSSINPVSSISSLFSTLPPFSSICASPISLSSTQCTAPPPDNVSSSALPLTFGSYHKKLPHHVSVLTSHSSLPSITISPLSSSLTTPPEDNPQITAPQVSVNTDSITVTSGSIATTSNEGSPPQTSSALSSSPSHTATVSTEASTSTGPPVSMATPPEGSNWMMKGVKLEEEDLSAAGEAAGLGVNDVTSQQLKLAQQKLAMLQRHSFSPLYKPTDISSLERVGSDSQNNVFWYDGGRNLYQSPPIWDPSAKPKESELVLVCKSFIQWQNKLKQLRSSCHEPDSKLAQIIKQMYLSRVKIATKRKTKDPAAISTHQQRNSSPMTTPSIAQNMASAASAAIQQASGLTSLQVPQGLPQGSILVVPSSTVLQGGGGTAGFSGVPLLLANTAVIVPQNIQTQPPLSSSQFTASQMMSYESPHHNISIRETRDIIPRDNSHNTKKNKTDSKPLPPSSEEEVVIQRVEAPKNIYQPYATVSVATNPAQPTHSFFPPVQLMKEGEELVKKQLFFTPQSSKVSPFSASGVEILKVEPEAEMGLIDKNTKSLEILEEVPIRKVSLDSSFTAHEGTLVYQSFSQQQQKDPLVISGQTNHNEAPPTSSSQFHLPVVSIATGVTPPTTYSRTMSESNAIVALTELATKGRTTQEVMSAKTLLSLHGPGGQPIVPSIPSLAPPTSSVLSRPKKTPRKQKPVASARSIVPPGNQGNPPLPPPSAPPIASVNKTHSSSPVVSDVKPKRKEYTPEELLKILEIPSKPNQFEEPSSASNSKKPDATGTQELRVSSPVKSVEFSRKETQHHKVPDKELLTSVQKGGEPRKASPVIREEGPESESDSSGSSSESDSSSDDERKDKVKKQPVQRQTHPLLSSRVMSHTGAHSSSSSSSSDSSSSSTDDSSDDDETTVVHPKSIKGKKGGTVKSRAPVKRQKATNRSVKDLSRSVSRPIKTQQQKAKKPQKPPAPVESKKQQKPTTVKRLQKKKPLPVVKSQAPTKKGRAQRPPTRQKKIPSLIVSILRRHLETAKKTERKKKQVQESDTENESDDSLSSGSPRSPGKSSGRKDGSGPTPDLKKYYNPDHVDLKTLSELTQSVEPGKDGGSRSKRTCVRVREEIAKLQELLDANGEKIKIPAGTPSRTQGGGGGAVSKGQIKGGKRRRISQGTTSKKKKQKSSQKEVSQLRSSSKSSNSTSNMKPKYVFSTQLANQAAEAVWRGKFESVISFHKSQQQVKGSKILRLPSKESLGGSRSMWETNGRLNLRPRSSISKSTNNSNNRGKRSVRDLSGNQGELRRSKRLAKTKDDSEEEESEDEEEEEEEEEEEDNEKRDKSKLVRSSVRRRRSPLVPDDISTPSSDDATSSASESNREQEEEEVMEEGKEEKGEVEEEAPNSPSPPPNDSPQSVKSLHMTTPQPRPSEHIDPSHVAPSNQTPLHTPAGTPNQPPSKEEVNYTICHGTPETRLSSADIEHTSGAASSQTRPQPPIVTQHGSVVMATSGNISTGHMTWSGGFPHSQLHGPYPQLYNKIQPPGAVYPHQPYPYQVTYPWPHPPEHMEHPHQLSITPAALQGNWPTPPSTYHQTKDVGNKTSSSSLSSRSHYYSSTGKHSSASSHHHLASATPSHFPFPQPGGGGSVNPQYSFESHHPSLAAAAHVWPSHQLPHPQLHSLVPAAAAAAHPTHLTPQGIPWSPYPRHLQGHVGVGGHHHHLNIGQDRISVIDKSKTKEGKSGESKINSNNNNNNNNNNDRFLSPWSPPAR